MCNLDVEIIDKILATGTPVDLYNYYKTEGLTLLSTDAFGYDWVSPEGEKSTTPLDYGTDDSTNAYLPGCEPPRPTMAQLIEWEREWQEEKARKQLVDSAVAYMNSEQV